MDSRGCVCPIPTLDNEYESPAKVDVSLKRLIVSKVTLSPRKVASLPSCINVLEMVVIPREVSPLTSSVVASTFCTFKYLIYAISGSSSRFAYTTHFS